MLMSAKKYKRNFIKNRYLYGKIVEVSKPDGKIYFFAINVTVIKSALNTLSMKSVALMVQRYYPLKVPVGLLAPPPQGPVGLNNYCALK